MIKYGHEIREFQKLTSLKVDDVSFESLTNIVQSFLRLPFENVTKILNHKKNLKEPSKWKRFPDVVLFDHIKYGTGGTCFSLTNFIMCILDFFGFENYPVLCDRSYGEATHSAVIVKIRQKKYLIDPGYLLGKPIELREDGLATGEKIKLMKLGESKQYALFTPNQNGIKLRYRFQNINFGRENFDCAWMKSFEWAMMKHISIGKATNDGFVFSRDLRINLNNNNNNKIKNISSKFGINEDLIEETIKCIKL